MTRFCIAKNAGFCFGVDRSVGIAEEALSTGPCACLGELVHNDQVIQKLSAQGLRIINDPQECAPGDRVLIRAHGIGREVYSVLRKRGAEIIDATCPFVAKVHKIVENASQNSRLVIIIGDNNHPEVKGICGWASEYIVLDTIEDAQKTLDQNDYKDYPITVVTQTTQTKDKFNKIVNFLKNRCTNIDFFDTICCTTSKRQAEAAELSANCDAMIVIGDPNSANSRHLSLICTENCKNVISISGSNELDTSRLKGVQTVGITAGASVPAWIIKEVVKKMSDEIKVEEISAEEVAATAAAQAAAEKPDSEKSFDELLEESIRTISNGDKVSGYVVAISNTEVSVDLGTKHSAYIPVTEFTDDGAVKAEDVIHVGDEIEAVVVRVNDVEGTVMLSKKRLDSIKSWADVESAQEEGTVVEGKVTEENKGGVVVSVKGIRVFVPASQTGLPRETAMAELLGQTVRLKITEVNRARKRVVGSIRAVASRERKERAEKIWAEIEVGKHYDGVVKSMTSYGAFVDIGGIDGMIHVSEISWERISKPADALNIGDKIDVYVISFDKEARKISLGHRLAEENPWKKFVDTYAVGDVANVKIVKLMAFGAFAEVMPGVDGLIHISQIANRRIAQASEVLNVGDLVDAKIINIDNEKQKISLSIRALSEPAPAEQEETAE